MRVEAYTANGIATGVVAGAGHLREHLDGTRELLIEGSDWLPIDGSAGYRAGDVQLPVDDLLMVASDDLGDVPGHAQWHRIDLDSGPFRIEGELSTMPGFDPGRALTRPTGQFVLLRDVRITLVNEPGAGEASCAHVLINRYTVDRIAADIMLGFFFPGAAMSMTLGGATTAGAPIQSATPTSAAPATPTTPAASAEASPAASSDQACSAGSASASESAPL
jgi:hypothetical protein